MFKHKGPSSMHKETAQNFWKLAVPLLQMSKHKKEALFYAQGNRSKLHVICSSTHKTSLYWLHAWGISIPYKEMALECCDEVEPFAKAIGAVNTVVRRKSDGKFVGYNTDCKAAITAIEDGLGGRKGGNSPLFGKHVVVIGAGGAGKAIAYGAKHSGATVYIANRHYERAVKVAQAVGGTALTLEQLHKLQPDQGSVLINTTAVGMYPNEKDSPMPKDALRHYSLVFDAVYTPKVTRLLSEAEELGIPVVSGMEMFIRQAIEQFSLFIASPVPERRLREVMISIM